METQSAINFSAGDCVRLLYERRHGALSAYFLDALDKLAKLQTFERSAASVNFCDVFMQSLGFCFAQTGYVPDPPSAVRFVAHNATIASIAEFSNFGTTDTTLRMLLAQPNAAAKTMALYSPRNSVEIPAAQFFDADPVLASHWWFAYQATRWIGSAEILARLRKHWREFDPRLRIVDWNFNGPYFLVTYADPAHEAGVKSRINALVRQRWPAPPPCAAETDPRHIVVLSAFWYKSHAVWRTNQKFLESLRGKYRLTLVTIGYPKSDYDLAPFERVIQLPPDQSEVDVAALRNLGAAAAFYPDVGMSPLSIVLANHRIAPVQFMTHGHPSSTFGSEIDYYISGRDIDGPQTVANYAERLALIGGRGVDPTYRSAPADARTRPDDRYVVSCPWTVPKTNADMVALLRRIADRADRPVHFHFMPGRGIGNFGYFTYADILEKGLPGSRVTVHPPLATDAYLAQIRASHLTLDSYPFGGFNTVVDALNQGVAIVAYEGARAFAKFGAHFLRKADLGELVATDDESYVATAGRILNDAGYRNDLEARIAVSAARQELYTDSSTDFPRLVDYLIANHEKLRADKSRAPIAV